MKVHAVLMNNVQTNKGHILVFADWDIGNKAKFA